MKFTCIVDHKAEPPYNWMVICASGVVKSGLSKDAALAFAKDLNRSRNTELFVRDATPIPAHLVRKAAERLGPGSRDPSGR